MLRDPSLALGTQMSMLSVAVFVRAAQYTAFLTLSWLVHNSQTTDRRISIQWLGDPGSFGDGRKEMDAYTGPLSRSPQMLWSFVQSSTAERYRSGYKPQSRKDGACGICAC